MGQRGKLHADDDNFLHITSKTQTKQLMFIKGKINSVKFMELGYLLVSY